jgi:hypothetical protein
VLVGALLVAAIPAMGAVGDPVILGKANTANAKTTVMGTTDGGVVFQVRNKGKGPAARFVTDAGQPPFRVTSPEKVPHLTADRVDDRHAAEIIRMTDNTTANAPDKNGNIISATIQVPKPGYLLTYGSVEAFGNAWDYYWCRIKVGANVVTHSRRDSTVHYEGVGHTDNREEDCAATGAIQVGTGPHTVHLNVGDVQTVVFGRASVWALYIPFDYSGAAP